jgi:low temperature requirement protein LtrA
MYAAYHQWALGDGSRQPSAMVWAVRHWLIRLAALAFCTAAFWLIAFVLFGGAIAIWVAAFAATGLFPCVLGIRWRDRQSEACHGADRAHHSETL